jgi:demethylmenaquinone methyltransferase/2-methoxy-6-polyprenyl-1,4-benzoquinol methylase
MKPRKASSDDPDPRIDFFDRQAAGWDDEGPGPEDKAAQLEAIDGLLGLRSGMDLLEVGCGTGQLTAWLAARVAPGTVTAVDFSPEMIREAKKKSPPAELRCLDVCSEPLEAASLDVVFCHHVFPHLRDQGGALRNFSRALRPGGRLIVIHMRGSKEINDFHASLEGVVSTDLLPVGDAWLGLLEQAGMRRGHHEDHEGLFFLEAFKDGQPA